MSTPGEASPSVTSPARSAGHSATHDPVRLLSLLDVSVPRRAVPLGYRIGMALLVEWLVLIPLLFAMLLMFLGWLAIWHVLQAIVSLPAGPYFVFHVPMALIGALLLAFLIKPIFFRYKSGVDGAIVLKPEDEPLLFEFVQRLCMATGSKVPSRIEVDCEANAAAALKQGLGSKLKGELVLRLGLPIVAGLPLAHFAGVLGHEFGHFNQRGGMTASYLIRRLSQLFAKIVFQRDRFDLLLLRLRKSRRGMGILIYAASMPFIEAARGVLWLLLILGELLTCGVLRRMEYDADDMEARLSGVKEFVQTNEIMAFLSIASQQSQADLAVSWAHGRLAENLPELVVANARQLADRRDEVLNFVEKQKTHFFDTHPSHADRVASVRRLQEKALIRSRTSPTVLFTDFDGLCRRTTLSFYRTKVGAKVDQATLAPTHELIEQRSGDRQAYGAMGRFFQGVLLESRPIFPGPEVRTPIESRTRTRDDLDALRHQMMFELPQTRNQFETYSKASHAVVIQRTHVELLEMFRHSQAANESRKGVSIELARNIELYQGATRDIEGFEKLMRARLTLALRALDAEKVAAHHEGTDGHASVAALLDLCQVLEPQVLFMHKLRESAIIVRAFGTANDRNRGNRNLMARLISSISITVDLLTEIRSRLKNLHYPEGHPEAGHLVVERMIPKIPSRNDPVAAHNSAMVACGEFNNIVFYVLSRLTDLAEKSERAVGLEPLPQPKARVDLATVRKQNERKYWLHYGTRATGGVALLSALVWMSVFPPTLPAMSWNNGPPVAYKPQGFGTSTAVVVNAYTPTAGYQLPQGARYAPGYTPPPGTRQQSQPPRAPWRPPQPAAPSAPQQPYQQQQPGYHPPQAPQNQPRNEPQPGGGYQRPWSPAPGGFGGGGRFGGGGFGGGGRR